MEEMDSTERKEIIQEDKCVSDTVLEKEELNEEVFQKPRYDEERFWQLLKESRWTEIRSFLMDMNPVDAADLLNDIEEKDKLLIIFKLLNKDKAAAIFTYLDKDLHRYILEGITSVEINDLLKRMFFDDAVDLLEELPANMVQMLLAAAPPNTRTLINRALRYPDNSAGSLMTVEYIALYESMTVQDALDETNAKTFIEFEL